MLSARPDQVDNFLQKQKSSFPKDDESSISLIRAFPKRCLLSWHRTFRN